MDRSAAFGAILVGTLLLCVSGVAYAHKPLLSVGDNDDGTISIEAGFSDGSSAAGHKIVLKDEKTEATVSEHRVGEDGTLQLKKPSVPYKVTLDAGEGHIVTKPGPPPSTTEKIADTGGTEPGSQESASVTKNETAAPSPVQPAGTPTQATAGIQPVSVAPMSQELSPGAVMAFKMMITAQIVTATALIILLAGIAYFVGYTIGKRSGSMDRT